MSSTTVFYEADSPTLKRSKSENDSPTFFALCPTPKKVEFTITALPLPSPTPRTPRRTYESSHRRKASIEKSGRKVTSRSSNMQAQKPSAFAMQQAPSFMTVFQKSNASETNSSTHSSNTSQSDLSKDSHGPDTIFSPIEPTSFNPFHQPRNSTSTSASESTDSSPTTTVSLDSSSMTEPSPGPSPQSPTAMQFAMTESRFTPIEAETKPMLPPTLPVFEMKPVPTSSSRKPRNLKNLAVNTTASYNLGRAIATAPLKTQDTSSRVSAPASPAFVKPPTPPKRKLGKMSLTIMTPANSNLNPLAIPATPSAINRPMTLRHFQSSPSLPLYTAGAGPTGGMTLPARRTQPAPRGFAVIPQEVEEEEDEFNYDVPQSREEKPESYPNGPIRIYESGVDLYYEPSVEVASRYDVIMNVASEVLNPFDVAEKAAQTLQISQPTLNVGVLSAESSNAGSPTTPKATPITTNAPSNIFTTQRKRPEYIHIPWEHNTDIVPELLQLVKVIDDRVKQGKTVLVHCQCGVSRSASLIVAYGMYTNPQLSVQEAYDAVKARSKWIGPNMSLIMQLQEYRSAMLREARQDQGSQNQSFPHPRKVSTGQMSSTTDSFDVKTPSEPATPRTGAFTQGRPTSPQRLNSSDFGPFSAGPVEPGTGSIWDSAFTRSWGTGRANNDASMQDVSMVPDTNYVDTKGHVVPVVTMVQTEPSPERNTRQKPNPPPIFSRPLPFRRDLDNDTQMSDAPPMEEPLMSPRSTEFHMTSISPPSNVESNDTFHILSPTTTEFPTHPAFPLTLPRAPAPASTPIEAPIRSQIPPPPPARAAPLPPPRREVQMESLDSIFSPTVTGFPEWPLSNSQPIQNGLAPPSRPAQRVDSLIPDSPPMSLGDSPKPNMRLRSKFSAPNLSECIKLQKIQTDIANKLPQKSAEAEEALLSPRAYNFVANPFHRVPTPVAEEPSLTIPVVRKQKSADTLTTPPATSDSPSTPTPSDPRSPAQFGISPINRNIWGMI
ncbi:hypothetical protein BT63DRAFT_414733 [Microthyrium microscopicum]|uniref:protein-tyrosine-phosphatase n=1 Tax=Microthyrium microscopicum TaxID=703497 RepID=A0A6A6U920_9PEZI|nr:hypothetical protein BT63DRAFT_414733 [Microthyrium microscopicum]